MGENLTAVWYRKVAAADGTASWESRAFTDQDQSKAICAVREVLALADSTGGSWPVAVAEVAAAGPEFLAARVASNRGEDQGWSGLSWRMDQFLGGRWGASSGRGGMPRHRPHASIGEIPRPVKETTRPRRSASLESESRVMRLRASRLVSHRSRGARHRARRPSTSPSPRRAPARPPRPSRTRPRGRAR